MITRTAKYRSLRRLRKLREYAFHRWAKKDKVGCLSYRLWISVHRVIINRLWQKGHW